MSDDESYYSAGSGSDSESEVITNSKKSNLLKPKLGLVGGGNSLKISNDSTIDDDSDSDSDSDEIDLIQSGGVGDDDPEDIASIVSSDDDASEVAESDVSEDEEPNEEGEENIDKPSEKKNKTKPLVKIDLPSDDEDEDYDDSYLQKFDNEVTKNYINDFHPECLIQNYDEISKLTSVVRDSNNIVIDPLHKTIPFLTKYEKARVIGQRAKQIEVGARPFISVPENVIDSYVIAELELQQKRIPFIIRRPIPSGGFEYWNIRDLEVIGF